MGLTKTPSYNNDLQLLEFRKPTKELASVKSLDELKGLLIARQKGLERAAGANSAAKLGQGKGSLSPRTLYQKNKAAREQLSLQLLMHLNGEQIASIKEEFHAHNDEVDLEDFCTIMEHHQPESLIVIDQKKRGEAESTGDSRGEERNGTKDAVGNGIGDGETVGGGKIIASREDVISNLSEVFKEVDINGDDKMELDEFTRFVVMKAQQHRAQMSIDQLAEYRQGSRQARMMGVSMIQGVTP